MKHSGFLDIACEEAALARDKNETAAGAVLVKGNQIVSRSHDRRKELNNPIAAPEMDCIRQAGRRNDQLSLTLYSTRYPDMLTVGTVLQFSIGSLVIGLPKARTVALDLLAEKGVPVYFEPHENCMLINPESHP